MEQYIPAIVLTSCFVAVSMTFVKKVIFKKKKINDTVLRTIAVAICAIATVLSWWILSIPAELKACLLYFFPVYVIQEIVDLDVIKRIFKAIAKARLKKAGVEEDVGL